MGSPVNASILSLPILYRHVQVWRNLTDGEKRGKDCDPNQFSCRYDVAVVHAGYARWRKKLLRYGWNYMNSSRRVNKVVRYTIAHNR